MKLRNGIQEEGMARVFPVCLASLRLCVGKGLRRLFVGILLLLLTSDLCLLTSAAAPSWWVSRGVINTNTPPNDFAPVTQGQVKHMAYQAWLEMEESLSQFGGAGDAISDLVQDFSGQGNYFPINLGQLKNLAAPFYDRLIELEYTDQYPWIGAAETNDFAPANIGQVKNLFSFDVTLDTDGDGMPDWWEMKYFGGATNAVALADDDQEGLTNLEEYLLGTDPTQWDTSGDGISDRDAVASGISPVVPATNVYLGVIEADTGTDALGSCVLYIQFNPSALCILAAGTAGTMRPAEYFAGQHNRYTAGSSKFAYYHAQSMMDPEGSNEVLRILFQRIGTNGTPVGVSVYPITFRDAQQGHIIASPTVSISGVPDILP